MAKKRTSKIAVNSQTKKTAKKADSPALFVLKTIIFGVIDIFLVLSMYDAAGTVGIGIKAVLTSLFGSGAYIVPLLVLYFMYTYFLKFKGESAKLKNISASVCMLFYSASIHITGGFHIEKLGFENLKSITEGGRKFLNGGIFGTYIAEAFRMLTGNIMANILIILITVLSVCFMFLNTVVLLINKIAELLKKSKKEKSSKIFRVPGIKVDKEASDIIEKEKKKDDIELPDIFKKGENGDVIIEKFAKSEPEIHSMSGKSAEDKDEKAEKPEKSKETRLTKKEKNEVSKELEEAKNTEEIAYKYPTIDFLNKADKRASGMTKEALNENAKKLVSTLHEFNVEAEVISIQEGPAVTRYEIRPEVGVKISKIMGLSEDIALRMAAKGIRIAPIPGKTVIGVEIANKKVMPVFIRDVISSQEFVSHKSVTSFALGKDIAGTTIVGDIAKMPHCLIAGATGSGKSVCINTLITSILYKSSPEEVKMIMIDPKVVELSIYNGIPHLLIPVVTDPRKAAGALNWAVMEMLNRYNLFAKANVRDLESYNEYLIENGEKKLPKIVVIVDELADLMMASPKEVEGYICRLAQLARAAGIHLVIATQRPSVDVITGLIKANIPSRIAFAVSSSVDSRTILDMSGAEKLLGKGDMLYAPVDESKPIRVQGAFITDKEVEKIVTFLKEQTTADYDDSVMEHIENTSQNEAGDNPQMGEPGEEADVMLGQCIEFVVNLGEASVSKLQRRFKLGYSRAARIVDQMEERGIVGPSEGSKPRQVLINHDQYLELMNTNPEWASK